MQQSMLDPSGDPPPEGDDPVSDIPAAGACIASRYVVEELIATGGMSVVVRARDLRLGQAVALKVMRPSHGICDMQVTRFLREARTVAKLRSEYIVRILDVDTTSSPPYLAMELLEGGDVAKLLNEEGPRAVGSALQIVIQACRGVAHAHAIGVVHRDLKPSNLLVVRAPDGGLRVKVIDFGVSKMVVPDGAPDLTSSGQIIGSPRYMSPEQVRGNGTVDARSDVWALGAILYELLTGAAPFDAATVADTLARVVSVAPAPLRARAPRAPARLEAIVAMCLEKDAALRPPSVAALLEELEAIEVSERLRGDAPEAPRLGDTTLDGSETRHGAWSRSASKPVPPPASPASPSRKRRGGAWAFALATLVLSVAAIPWRERPTGAAAVVGRPDVAIVATTMASAAPSATAPVDAREALAVPASAESGRALAPPASRGTAVARRRPVTAASGAALDAGARDEDLELNRRD